MSATGGVLPFLFFVICDKMINECVVEEQRMVIEKFLRDKMRDSCIDVANVSVVISSSFHF